MPTSPSPRPRPRLHLAQWRPSRSALLWMLGAFALGLLLFVLVWANSRDKPADGDIGVSLPATAGAPDYQPLPAPLPAGGNAGERGLARPLPPAETAEDGERPQLVETTPPPPPSPVPAAPEPPAQVTTQLQPTPLPGQMPAPSYPSRALRRGERGNVLVRVDVGPDGVPTSVSISAGSGSRSLDRAATEAVRRWRFRPARGADGQPTVGTVLVPIEFNPG